MGGLSVYYEASEICCGIGKVPDAAGSLRPTGTTTARRSAFRNTAKNSEESMKRPASVNSARSGGASDPTPRSGRLLVLRLTRTVGALALLVVGGVHLEQY